MIWLLVAAFATYRIARMVAEEDGPWDAFKRFRDQFTDDQDWFAKGIRCQLCIGVWVAGLLTANMVIQGLIPWGMWLPAWFGVAGLAVKIKEFWQR